MHIFQQFLKLFFHLLYHKFAWTYDLVAWVVSVGKWKTWTQQGTSFLSGSRVLELGHGPGHLLTDLNLRGYQAYGVDESREMSLIARHNILKMQKTRTAQQVNGYAKFPSIVRSLAQVLPFATHSFDSIIATFPTEYIVDPGSLKEIRRVLCPGGVLVIVLGAWITGRSFLDRSAAWLFHITGQSPDWNPFYADPLTQAGFSVEQHFIHLSGSYVLVLVAS